MNFLEIAVPLVSESLTIFVGSGFSKYLTDNKAPSWTELLEELAKEINFDAKADYKSQDKEPYSYAPKSMAEPAILVLPSLSEYKASRTVLRIVLSVNRFLNVSEFESNPLSIAIEPTPSRKLASAKFRLPSLGWMLFFLIIVKFDSFASFA